jgi:hypothetical protein
MPAAKTHACETCRLRAYESRHPRSLLARLWRWHTRWCPGWKSYQRHLAEQDHAQPPDATPDRDDGR